MSNTTGLPPQAYMFWYMSSQYAPTEYVYIIAFSEKQARMFFIKNGYTRMYDYSLNPVRVVKTTKRHEVGDMLGQYARL